MLGLEERPAAQEPERLFGERRLLALVIALAAVLGVLSMVEVPALEQLSDPHYIRLPLD
ncbi:MAG: hypothetical protein R3325_07735 [Thermoanaerobaculia bacterium]|nr:hypothetical protein [Thermoanaerobaculia bacterium]